MPHSKPLLRRMVLRLCAWAGGWLGNAGAKVCWWAYKLREYADRNVPKCPDCHIAPWDGSDDFECAVCKQQREYDREAQAQYDGGYVDGWTEAYENR